MAAGGACGDMFRGRYIVMKRGFGFFSSRYVQPGFNIRFFILSLFLLIAVLVSEIWQYYGHLKLTENNARKEAVKNAEYLEKTILRLILVSNIGGAIVDGFVEALNTEKRLQIRPVHSKAIDAQFGFEPDELPMNQDENSALLDGRTRQWETDESFVSVLALKAVKKCRTCHHMPDAPEIPVPVGYVLGLVEITHSKDALIKSRNDMQAHTARSIGLTIIVFFVFGYSFHRMTVAFRQSAQRTTAIIKTVGEGIVVIDQDSRICLLNQEVCNIFGYSEDELIGEKTELLVPEKYKARHREGVKRYSAKGQSRIIGSRIELEGVRKSGEVFPLELRLEETRLKGGERFVTGAIRDITERKEAEEALKESEEKFRGAFTNAAAGMVLVGMDGGILKANDGFCEMIGYSEKELMEMTFTDIMHPDDVEKALYFAKQMQEGNKQHYKTEKRHLHKLGHTVWVSLNVSIVRSGDGDPKYFIIQTLDITEKKETQRALKQFSRKLVERQEWERKRIASGLHDGLGQNLLVIKNGIRKCLKSLSGEAKLSDILKNLASISQESIEEIRVIAYGLHPHQLDKLGLKGAINSVISKVSTSSGIKFHSSIDGIDGLLEKDNEIHLYRAIQEGLNNIVQHSGAKEARISIDVTDGVMLVVLSDNGKGFDSTIAKSYPPHSTGLGLKDISERVKILSGEFIIDSAPGEGVVAKLRIPIPTR